ncbi:LysR family transcriptional regulator [Nocardiopsis composta]|uniref:DNA-binding transcriptional LysR family regulator n=1 Tax=Nocardiopsis composta TaxID=157465 RepID=A0A7W8QJB1_9ACTN|nr:LysR family transcriptional regulator [Nocardiopsis composta]MBB5431533.1 DNA-binding transcriptional LysR family regulator [Nocardiopsis composta]
MDLTRLRLLMELERLGTMAAVAEVAGMGTSAVSKHFAVLEKEVGVPLLVPDGRRVRLTPAGHRLAEYAVDILGRVEAARAELSGHGEPVGRVDLATFVSLLSPVVLPALARLGAGHPGVDVRIIENEPDEALALLQNGGADLALVYEYSLVPRRFPDSLRLHLVGTEPLLLSQPSSDPHADSRPLTRSRLRRLSGARWIANSRGGDDDELVGRMCAAAGFAPEIGHRVDNLEVVERMVAAGLAVGVMPKLAAATRRGVVHSPLGELGGHRRIYLVGRAGAWAWLPTRLVARELHTAAAEVLDGVAPLPADETAPLPGEGPGAAGAPAP